MRVTRLRAATVFACLATTAIAAPAAMATSSGDSLLAAIRTGDTAAVSAALASGARPNRLLPDGSSLLSWAVETQNPEMVQLLLAAGAKADVPASGTMTPLGIACELGEPTIVNQLLDAKARVRRARPDGITPLALCAGSLTPEVLERMLAAGAEIDRADDKGQTPLMWASARGRVDNLRLLARHGAAVNRSSLSGFTPLFFALKSGNSSAAEAIVELGGNPEHVAKDGTSAVQLAMYQKNFAFVATRVTRGADLTAFDRNGHQLLHAAAAANRPELVRLLLAKGADPNALTGPSLVQYRYEVNFTSAPFDMPARPPLLLAAQAGAAEVMTLLLDAGADGAFRDKDGTNVVLAAVTSGKLAALEVALRISPDANTTTGSGQTALHLLMFADATPDTPAIMKLLAQQGARSDVRNRSGQRPVDLLGDAQTGVKEAFAASFQALPRAP